MMDRSLSALDAHLRERNETERRRVFGDTPRRRRSQGPAETAPMPDEPGVCRWCRGRLKALKPGAPATYCQASCAANETEPYLRQCQECGRDFRTGKHHTDTCYACEQKDQQQIEAHARAERTAPTRTRDDWAERRRA